MKIKIICVGKIKEKYLNDLNAEYIKRLNRFCKLEIREVKDLELKDESERGIENLLATEASEIRKHLQEGAFKICLAIEGKQLTSEDFASKLEDVSLYNSNIQFIIGGSYGLCKTIKKECDFMMSFSKMTFPHQLMRGILLEQVYRGFKINNNQSYHK